MENPRVSIVILTTSFPEKVIDDLKAQSFQDFEVLIADEPGIVNAMNCALERARGEIMVRIDDDVELPKNWLKELIKPFDDSRVVGTTGPTFVPHTRRHYRDSIKFAENPKGVLRWLYDNNHFNPAGIRECGCVSYDSNYQERFGDCEIFSCERLEGTNWAMRAALIRRVGGFDPAFDGVCEWFDEDVQFKVREYGDFIFNPEAWLWHVLEKGDHYEERFDGFGRIKNFLRFHWRHGKWRFFNIKFYVYLTIWMGYFVCKRVKFL